CIRSSASRQIQRTVPMPALSSVEATENRGRGPALRTVARRPGRVDRGRRDPVGMSIAIGTLKTLESGDREPDDRRPGRRSSGGPRAPRPNGSSARTNPTSAHYRHEDRSAATSSTRRTSSTCSPCRFGTHELGMPGRGRLGRDIGDTMTTTLEDVYDAAARYMMPEVTLA